MKVKIKKYWKVYYYSINLKGEQIEREYIVEGKNPQEAVESFYELEYGMFLRNGTIISKIEALTIEVKGNE